MNNVDLHLIKGRPAVHADDDLIVGHIAITVSGEKMDILRERLTSMGVKFRKNVSVPNPTVKSGPNKGRTDQVLLRILAQSLVALISFIYKCVYNALLTPISGISTRSRRLLYRILQL